MDGIRVSMMSVMVMQIQVQTVVSMMTMTGAQKEASADTGVHTASHQSRDSQMSQHSRRDVHCVRGCDECKARHDDDLSMDYEDGTLVWKGLSYTEFHDVRFGDSCMEKQIFPD